MGTTKKTEDWLGREKEVHIDDEGNKVGETRFTTDWLGNKVQEHIDNEGAKIGETRAGQDWLGRSRAEHIGNERQLIGTSRNETDWRGRPVQRHYYTSGAEAGETRTTTDWRGRPIKEHEGEYFKTHGTAGAGTEDVDHYGSSSSFSGKSNSGSAKGMLSFLGCLVILGLLALLVMRTKQSPASPTETAVVTLQQAKTIIPQNLHKIYHSLNAGDPRAIAGLVTPQLLKRSDQLDRICRPYTYRAHYIEAIIERPDGVFEARVHSLFKPEDEQADILLFAAIGGQLVLQDVQNLPDEWFGQEKLEAISVARRFIYAARAGKKDTLTKLISPNLDISPLFENADYASRLKEVNSITEEGAGIKQQEGLKVQVNLTTGRKQFCGDLWHFLIDTTGRNDKIVEWEFVPIFGCYLTFQAPNIQKHVDPELETYTLRRFGLLRKEQSNYSPSADSK